MGTIVNSEDIHSVVLDGKVMLFVGRIHCVKALDNLIRAWAMVRPKGWQLRIVGPDEDGYQKKLLKLVGAFGLGREIVFPGPRFGQALNREYSVANCFIMPSHSENFSGVVIDALAHGVPVVASKYTPWSILVKEGCGWWTDNTVESLAETLANVVKCNREKLLAMGAAGRALVERSYTWQVVSDRLQAVYSRISQVH